jgi:hypothetical protein
MSGQPVRRFLFAVLAGLTFAARADDADALRLADEAPEAVVRAGDWRSFAEVTLGAARRRGDGSMRHERRLSLDVRYDHAFADGWRLVFADRLDASWPAPRGDDRAINTVKEAYLSRRLARDTLVDFGRVNVRHGAAIGYNPTDYFRRGALRSVVSIDPATLKENRQGSVLLRGQRLWQGGSLTALFSPRLARQPGRDGFSLDWGATNDSNRLLVVLTQRIDTLSPQFLFYGEEGRAAQLGINLSGLVNDATVAYVEWSGGRGPSQFAAVLRRADAGDWRNRLAGGLAYTTTNKLSLTAELHYDGAALDDDAWRALRRGPPVLYGLYRQWVWTAQELPTRQALFFRAAWPDAPIPRLDLAAMLNVDLTDSSRRAWLEARYRADRIDYALQWQRNSGGSLSNHGAVPESACWQFAVRFYF